MSRAVYVDAPWTPTLPGVVNALFHPTTGRPFDTLQAAHDFVASQEYYGTLWIPPGLYDADSTPAATGLVVGAVDVVGAGPAASVISMVGQSADVDIISVTDERARISGLTLRGTGTSGTGRGIGVHENGSGIERVLIERVEIRDTPSWCIEFEGDGSGVEISFMCTVRDSKLYDSVGAGAIRIGPGSTMNRIERVNMPMAPKGGHASIEIDAAWGTVIEHCGFDLIDEGGVALRWHTGEASGFPRGLDVVHCWFEDHSDPALWDVGGKPYCIDLDSRRIPANTGQLWLCNVERCRFVAANTGVGPHNLPNRIAQLRSDVNPHRGIVFNLNEVLTWQSGAMPTGDIASDIHGHRVLLQDNLVTNSFNNAISDLTTSGETGNFETRWAWS